MELPATMVDAVLESTAAADWLKASDRAVVKLASMYAVRLDQGAAEFAAGVLESTDYNKVLYLGPHLLNTLRALGCAPAERKELGGDGSVSGGGLARLRKIEGGRGSKAG